MKNTQKEVLTIAQEQLKPFRTKPYRQLRAMIGQEPITYDVIAESGKRYQIEIEVFWDNQKEGTIRVMCDIDSEYPQTIFSNIPILRWLPVYKSLHTESLLIHPK